MSLPRCLEELQRRHQAGERFDFLHFWGHRPPHDGSVSKSCLSQWFDAPFELEGIRYPTAEHFMMAAKARLFDDSPALERVLAAPTPGEAKAAGRRVTGFDDETWRQHRVAAVCQGNLAKFRQHAALRDYLLRSGDTILVEASPVDRIWGIGLAADDPGADNPACWRGPNLLGFALMDVRRLLRSAP